MYGRRNDSVYRSSFCKDVNAFQTNKIWIQNVNTIRLVQSEGYPYNLQVYVGIKRNSTNTLPFGPELY